ncbi:MAG: transposase [Chloroflexi bacterium]|nr:transposase [Chloroflexota bacterium]
MMDKLQKIDKETFKQIFWDHGEDFKRLHPRYQDAYIQEVIEKMLGCGDPAHGYTTYFCDHCLEEKTVAFSCKSCFCLSCCKVYIDQWVSHISQALYEGVTYRHVILTTPEDLRVYFYQDRDLLEDLMKCGVAMLTEAMREVKKAEIDVGYVVVLQTAGRSGHWNPHLHILMTSGGVTPDKRWIEVNYFPFEILHKKWQYHLFTMMKERLGTAEIHQEIDGLWRKYPNGLVAYWEKGKVPPGGGGLAYYLAKYVVSPPISLRRIISYDGHRVCYWYKDHKTRRREKADVPALIFIGRMVQHILPKGFHHIRYYGLQATCKAKKIREVLRKVVMVVGRAIQGAYRILAKKGYRERMLASTGRDPLLCPRCGRPMELWQIWHPRYGVIYDELKEIMRGRYEPRRVDPDRERDVGDWPEPMVQLSLPLVRV